MIRPWDDIRRHYAELSPGAPWVGAMSDLVEQVQASPTLSRLHAWTSMLDLFVVQTPVTYPYDGPRLLISPKAEGVVDFQYLDTMVEERRWRRAVPAADAFSRFLLFTDQLHWFAREG
jgi:hypothetical protein